MNTKISLLLLFSVSPSRLEFLQTHLVKSLTEFLSRLVKVLLQGVSLQHQVIPLILRITVKSVHKHS